MNRDRLTTNISSRLKYSKLNMLKKSNLLQHRQYSNNQYDPALPDLAPKT